MEIKVFPLGEMAANAYLLSSGGEAVVIDPADEGGFLAEKILQKNLQLKYILGTHGHFDHLLGLLELKLAFKNVPFLMSGKDVPILRRHMPTAAHFLGRKVDPAPLPDAFFSDGEIINVGEELLKVITTPGHTPGSVCFSGDGIIFTGDTIFAEGAVGRTEFLGSSRQELEESIKNKLLGLPPETVVYPGHGPETTIGEFKESFKA